MVEQCKDGNIHCCSLRRRQGGRGREEGGGYGGKGGEGEKRKYEGGGEEPAMATWVVGPKPLRALLQGVLFSPPLPAPFAQQGRSRNDDTWDTTHRWL